MEIMTTTKEEQNIKHKQTVYKQKDQSSLSVHHRSKIKPSTITNQGKESTSMCLS